MDRYIGWDVHVARSGVIASEGILTLPISLKDSDYIPALDSMFFEFLPMDEDESTARAVTLDKLELGKSYEIVVTTSSGLYRYRMRDAVKVSGFIDKTPRLEFLCRADNTVSLAGEKTTELALGEAIYNTIDKLGLYLVDYSVYPNTEVNPMRYEYFIENNKPVSLISPKEIRANLDRALCEANPSLKDKFKRKILGKTKLHFLEYEAYALYKDMMVTMGTSPGQVKPVHIIRNEKQRRLFYSCTFCSIEGLDF